MWAVILLGIYGTEAADRSFIALGDSEFLGPDAQLENGMKQRRTLAEEDLAEFLTVTNSTSTARVDHAHHGANRRLLEEIYTNTLRSGSKKDTEVDPMVLHLITLLIYNVQRRLGDLDPIVKKYEMDERLRFGHIFCTLEHWRRESTRWYSYLTTRWLGVHQHLVYYEHILSRDIDVSYTVRFLTHLQAVYSATLQHPSRGSRRDASEPGYWRGYHSFIEEIEKNNIMNMTEELRQEMEREFREYYKQN